MEGKVTYPKFDNSILLIWKNKIELMEELAQQRIDEWIAAGNPEILKINFPSNSKLLKKNFLKYVFNLALPL